MQLIPNKKMGWCFSYADRIGADRVIFIAPSEWAQGKVRVKQLRLADTEQNKEIKEMDILYINL